MDALHVCCSVSCRDVIHVELLTPRTVINLLPVCRQPMLFITPSTVFGVLLRCCPLPPCVSTSATVRRRLCGRQTARVEWRYAVRTWLTEADSCPLPCCSLVTAGPVVRTSLPTVPRRYRSVCHLKQTAAHGSAQLDSFNRHLHDRSLNLNPFCEKHIYLPRRRWWEVIAGDRHRYVGRYNFLAPIQVRLSLNVV